VETGSPAPLLTGRQRSNELVWVLKSNRGSVAVIDPATDSIIDVVEPGVRDTGDDIAIGDGAVWVSYLSDWVHRIDML
jgi:nitrogen regulatory protein PII